MGAGSASTELEEDRGHAELNVTMCVFFPSPTASMPMAVLNLGHIYPFQRGFFCKDNSIQYPYRDSTVTTTVLTVLGLGLPLSSVSKCTPGLPFAILTSRHTPFQRGLFCNDESIKYPYKDDTIPYALLGGILIPFSVIVDAQLGRFRHPVKHGVFTWSVTARKPRVGSTRPACRPGYEVQPLPAHQQGQTLLEAPVWCRAQEGADGWRSDGAVEGSCPRGLAHSGPVFCLKCQFAALTFLFLFQMVLGEALCVYCNLLHSNSFVRNNYVATIYKAVGTFLFGAAASQSLTDIAKYSIGRLRPHFLDVCDPDWSKINCSNGYIENYVCRGNAQKVKEGRLSFYSGHSSFSMYCMLFLALTGSPLSALPAGQDAGGLGAAPAAHAAVWPRGHVHLRGPFSVSDYKHHWSDVLTGLIQGALVAVLVVVYVSDFFKERNSFKEREEASHTNLHETATGENHFRNNHQP
ncbi:hypothetical protein QTO34_014120 [Cnephaeus nilssonii]|uniref:Phospholipid phosphatase 1 n=1 Tax=Cnephaeus nilssonii TaxID=3371016 RepID=A0AA40LVN8_CNENI|nr:hypothetical protein QTO34_014120 [Eptesicus nilssonii]